MRVIGSTAQPPACSARPACRHFNNFGFELDTPAEDLMYLMHTLLDKDHAQRILFGVDANYAFDMEQDRRTIRACFSVMAVPGPIV